MAPPPHASTAVAPPALAFKPAAPADALPPPSTASPVDAAPLAPPPAAADDAAAMASLAAGWSASPKALPCSFLYDPKGSSIYDEIVLLPEYYPFAAERRVLATHMDAIVAALPADAVLVELGCGTAEKTAALVAAVAAARGPAAARYVGTDCSPDFLMAAERNVRAAAPGADVRTVACLYEGAGAAAAALFPAAPLAFLWLGSSVGNLDPETAATLIRSCLAAGGAGSVMLLATDLWKDASLLRPAYDDPAGVTARFARNGVAHALACVPGGTSAAAAVAAWPYEVALNDGDQRVEMWVTCPAAFTLPPSHPHFPHGVTFAAHERVLVELSRKFTPARVAALAGVAGACVRGTWGDGQYAVQLLARE